jgi:hypothetical protein
MAFIEYIVSEYTTTTDQFATYDAIANIASQLTDQGFEYTVDFWLAEVYYKENGNQMLKFHFVDEKRAMLIKIKGIKNNG